MEDGGGRLEGEGAVGLRKEVDQLVVEAQVAVIMWPVQVFWERTWGRLGGGTRREEDVGVKMRRMASISGRVGKGSLGAMDGVIAAMSWFMPYTLSLDVVVTSEISEGQY